MAAYRRREHGLTTKSGGQVCTHLCEFCHREWDHLVRPDSPLDRYLYPCPECEAKGCKPRTPKLGTVEPPEEHTEPTVVDEVFDDADDDYRDIRTYEQTAFRNQERES